MTCDEGILRLYAVTDRAWTGRQTLYEQVERALLGGVTCVQLREKALDRESLRKEAEEIGALCRQHHVPFLIDDDVELAVACHADGVHVGQSDLEAGRARDAIGEDMILGVSAQTVEQALAAERAGADYLGVGAVFPTATKPDAEDVSYDTLRAICAAVKVPVVAIGGITKDNISRLSGSGVRGVALVSAIFAAEQIEGECRELLALSQKMVAGA